MSLKRQKNEHLNRYKHRNLTLWLLMILLILLPLCAVVTYTWFAISRTPKVSDMEMTINCNAGFQLAWSPDAAEEAWGPHLAFVDAVPDKTLLTPVTWSEANGCFYTTNFGADGRVKDIGVRLSDERDTNDRDGHYIKFTLYGRTGEHVDVSLAPAAEEKNGTACTGTYLLGPPLWDAEQILHVDEGGGAQYAIRVGLRITTLDAATRHEKGSTFFIYEPNGDRHVNGTDGYIPTPSMDGTDSLVPQERLLLQTASSWAESNPVQRDVVQYALGEFETETALFELTADELVRMDVYIWLEGMDADCVNAIGQLGRIFANLQFLAEPHDHSGIVPID